MFYSQDSYDIVVTHLRQQRDHLDQLIRWLESIKEWNFKNTHVVTSTAGCAAASMGDWKKMTIGGEPPPPPLPIVPANVTSVNNANSERS